MIEARQSSLWRHSNFRKLWLGRTISLFGSAITTLALPLTALLMLHASAAQMGLLVALAQLPPLLFGLLVGGWMDRVRRRPFLIVADLGQAALLALIPLAAIFHLLRIELIYVVSFLAAICSTLFTVASTSFLPSLVEREQLVEGNSALQLSLSAAQIVGPNLAGLLIQLITAPLAILGDCLSFLLSALCIGSIATRETPPARSSERQPLWREIGMGIRVVLKLPILRALAAANGTANIFWGMQTAILLLYLTNVLGLGPLLIGVIYAAGNVGFLVGTLLAQRLVRWCGVGPALIVVPLVSVVGALLVPLASGGSLLMALLLIAAKFLTVAPLIIYHIHEVSLRQSFAPDKLLGRVNATMLSISWATVPLGAVLGGWLGSLLGLRSTLFIVVVGLLLAQLWLLLSPLRSLRALPQRDEVVSSV